MGLIDIIGCEPDDRSEESYFIPDCVGVRPVSFGDVIDVVRHDGIDAPPHEVAHEYFLYLCNRVRLINNQKHIIPETADETYFNLAMKLHKTDFKVVVPLDDNRIADARNLRTFWALLHSNYNDYTGISGPGASMLEVMIGLCERFDTTVQMRADLQERTDQWFHLMLKNSSLDIFCDAYFTPTVNEDGITEYDGTANEMCDEIIKTINERKYDIDGRGGFFPRVNSCRDERKVDLWIQMHGFFMENRID